MFRKVTPIKFVAGNVMTNFTLVYDNDFMTDFVLIILWLPFFGNKRIVGGFNLWWLYFCFDFNYCVHNGVYL